MIIALYGASCVGKSTIATQLSPTGLIPIRRCGDVVREFAANKGVAPDQLSLEDHQAIDSDSVAWVARHSSIPAIIEGRFLDCVLGEVTSLIHLVHVRAEMEVRADRWVVRRPGVDGFAEVVCQDEADAAFRLWAYPGIKRLAPQTSVETTGEVGEWACLLKLLLDPS